MESKTTKEHQNESSNDISCGIITLSDSRNIKEDLSGDYIENAIKKRYNLKSRKMETQFTEQCLRVKLINKFNRIGLPKYELAS